VRQDALATSEAARAVAAAEASEAAAAERDRLSAQLQAVQDAAAKAAT
jgi:hypothetical protein